MRQFSFIISILFIAAAQNSVAVAANPYGKIGTARYYQEIHESGASEAFVLPRSDTLTSEYWIMQFNELSTYHVFQTRHTELQAVTQKPFVDTLSKYYVSVRESCTEMPIPDYCMADFLGDIYLIKVGPLGDVLVHQPGEDARAQLLAVVNDPSTPFSVKDIEFVPDYDWAEQQKMNAFDARFEDFKRRGLKYNNELRHKLAESEKAEADRKRREDAARAEAEERSRVIYQIDPGDTYYMAGAFNDIPVTVVSIDPQSDRVKVRRHDDGTVKWVRPDDLLDRDGHMLRNAARGIAVIGIAACVLTGDCPTSQD